MLRVFWLSGGEFQVSEIQIRTSSNLKQPLISERRHQELVQNVMQKSHWNTTILTLFPEMFPGPLGYSVTGRALEQHLWTMETVNFRDFSIDKHSTVDDTPFGGGPGMVMRPDVVDQALKHAVKIRGNPDKIIYLSPRGKIIDHDCVKELSFANNCVIICGRFEGLDQRALDFWDVEEYSLGDFVLCGGEVAAMALIESTLRFVPGVLGDPQSLEDESFASGLLEYPHYTRPRSWNGLEVPEVLLSGHHENIKRWRLEQSEDLTRSRRPDMWSAYIERKKV